MRVAVRGHQGSSVPVLRMIEDLRGRPVLDNAAGAVHMTITSLLSARTTRRSWPMNR